MSIPRAAAKTHQNEERGAPTVNGLQNTSATGFDRPKLGPSGWTAVPWKVYVGLQGVSHACPFWR